MRRWLPSALTSAPSVAAGPLTLARRVTVWLRGNRRVLGRALPFVLLVLGGLLWLRAFQGVSWGALARDVGRAGPWVVLLFAAPAVGNFVHMLGWRALLERSLRPRLGRAFRIFVAAQAGNELGASVLGESLKVALLPRALRGAALRAVFWDNLTALGALLCVLLSGLAFSFHEMAPEAHGRVLAVVLGGALLLGVAARLFARRYGARPNRAQLLAAFFAHLLGKLWIVVEMALALALLGKASAVSSAILGFSSTLGSCLGAPVPGQLGVVEGALVAAAHAARQSVSTVLCVALLRRARGLFWIALGAIFAVLLTRKTGLAQSGDDVSLDAARAPQS